MMNLGFIIEHLPYADHFTEEVKIAKGKYKVITTWLEAKEQIKWLKKDK
jgi:hypothetical protein